LRPLGVVESIDMQAIIFIGIQATGKSTFFKERFFDSFIRINLDLLKTRHREKLLLNVCIESTQKFVVDNTNTTIKDRVGYIEVAKSAGFEVIGYYFESKIKDALERNQLRSEERRIPERGILGTYNKLQLPSYSEGFNKLYYVRIGKEDEFIVEAWSDEI